MVIQTLQNKKWLVIALLILLSNFIFYQLPLTLSLAPIEAKGVVFGSIIDCAILVPALLLLHLKQLSVKKAVLFAASGIVFARIIIPAPLIEPFSIITWSGLLVEAAVVIFEISLIFLFVRYLPEIIRTVKASSVPLLFSFPQAVQQKASKNFIIQVLCAEMLMFYYAFFTWRKRALEDGFTVHKNSMYVAFVVMIFHACIFEAVAFHWLFHERWPVVAWVHLAMTVYGLIFILADFHATRLHPAVIQNGKLYLSNGLMKRTTIDLQQIEAIHPKIDAEDVYLFSILGNTEEKPQFILEMKASQTIYVAMGFEKKARYIGIFVDNPEALRKAITNEIA